MTNNKDRIMFFTISISIIMAILIWQFIHNEDINNTITNQNPKSFTISDITPLNASSFIDMINKEEGKNSVLIYFYTSWCSSCLKQFKVMNNLSANFQNKKITIYNIAIDKNIDSEKLANYLDFTNRKIYFLPFFMQSKIGLDRFFNLKQIDYKGAIPFFILIDINGNLIWNDSGYKSYNYLQKKINKIVN